MSFLEHGVVLFGILATMSALAALLDRLILRDSLEDWRAGVTRLWAKLNEPGARGLLKDANQLYVELFDYVYGPKILSWRRVYM